MPYHIHKPQTERIIRRLAKLKRKPIIEAIEEACRNELDRERRRQPLHDRLRPLIDKVKRMPSTGRGADKDFFDELSGNS